MMTSIAYAADNASAEAVVELSGYQISQTVSGSTSQVSYYVSGTTGASNFTSTSTSDTVSAQANGGATQSQSYTGTGTTVGQPVALGVADPVGSALSLNNGSATDLAGTNLTADLGKNLGTSGSALLVANLPILNTVVAAAGATESGSPIAYTPTSLTTNTGSNSSATLYSASYAAANSSATPTSNQHSQLGLTFTLTTTAAGNLVESGNLGAYAAAFLSSGASFPTDAATSNYNIQFSVKDVTTGVYLLNANINAPSDQSGAIGTGLVNSVGTLHNVGLSISQGSGTLGTGSGNTFNTTTGVLDNSYNFSLTSASFASGDVLSISDNIYTSASVQVTVPEPEILALMGIGLLAIGASSRKNAKSNSGLAA